MKIKIVVLITCFVGLFQIQGQQMLYKISIEEQIKESSLVIEGKVIEKRSYLNEQTNHICTLNKIEVLQKISGEFKEDYLYVISKGGTVGFNTEKVTPSLQLKKGSVGVFFLQSYKSKLKGFFGDNIYKVYSDIQGFYKYETLSNKVVSPFFSFENTEDFYEVLSNLMQKPLQLQNSTPQKAKKSLSAKVINSFTPTTVRAGTGETIVINGADFGDAIGSVDFEDADQGGGLANLRSVDNFSILSWSDSVIEVRVPSFAGTGKIRVVDQSGVNQFVSTNNLTVLSSESNITFDIDNNGEFDTTVRIKLVNTNGVGGYTWTYNNEFKANSKAVVAFEKSVNNWICATGINWTIDEGSSSLNVATDDGVNLVRFVSPTASNSDEIEPGTLGVTISYFEGCELRSGEVVGYLSEVDMTFNSRPNWNFEEGLPSGAQVDFQGTATHELGHAHSMGHVIDEGQLMHFNTFFGENSATRSIDSNTLQGAKQNFEFSKTGNFCRGTSVIKSKTCDSLSINTFVERPKFIVFQENNSIKVSSLSVVSRLSIFDLNGRLLVDAVDESELSTALLPHAAYVLVIEDSNGDLLYRKFSL